jgi:hypothetical protein
MSEKIKKIEDMLGKTKDKWVPDTLDEIVSNDETLQLFTEEVIIDLLKESGVNIDIQKILKPIKYGYLSKQVSVKLNAKLEALQANKITLEDFKKETLSMFDESDIIGQIGKHFAILLMFDNPKDHINESELLSAIDKYVDILESLDMDIGFEVIIGLIDPIIALREVYFQLTQTDLFDKNNRVNALLNKLDEKTASINKFMGKSGNPVIEPESKDTNEENKEDSKN